MNDSTNLKRILIIDDDSDFRKLLLLHLCKMFAGVELEDYDPIAKGVPDADFDWSRYDVLLLDYFLCIHGVTGLDIIQKNRKKAVVY
jgi:DNA-binding response OmpR family regulator